MHSLHSHRQFHAKLASFSLPHWRLLKTSKVKPLFSCYFTAAQCTLIGANVEKTVIPPPHTKCFFLSLVSLKCPDVYIPGRDVSMRGREPKHSLEATLLSGRWEPSRTVQDQAHLHTGAVRSYLAQVFNYDALGEMGGAQWPSTTSLHLCSGRPLVCAGLIPSKVFLFQLCSRAILVLM